ncbi:MAG TPA: energy-coupling factor transporter ATPase [Candidatus Limadaptatus stercorigallinarum]|uniref:Energy-coupling factor transporter ATPase n=1 Tax=Candidatus Limadaptatus stercorigallinarum TaxID=2840845 RepID=A0A9D1HSH3_9FIRM|nr:energy-coupling factor transporter ATPase [Candidatus Limadaptatus stercorigallinarum]
MPQIELIGVNYSYRVGEGQTVRALRNVSFSVEKGEFVALAGMNGSGKSTLAKLLNGLFTPSSGDVLIDGINTRDEERTFDVRRKAGMVFQNPDNQMVATIIEDDVAFGPENLGIPREEIVERVDWALDAVGMSEFRTRSASKLSGGQKQRVAIAGVLAMKPDILILDESTSMLDPEGRAEIMDVAKKLNASGITVISITHNMDEAAQADRVIVLRKGRLVLDGTPKEVFASPEVEACGLALPPPTEIARMLSERGFGFSETVTDEDALVEGICSQSN